MKKQLSIQANWLSYLLFGVIASILYIVFACTFITTKHFQNAWLLNVGNMLFMAVIGCYAWIKRKTLLTVSDKIVAGIISTLVGVSISCILIIVLVQIFPIASLKNTPSNNVIDSYTGFLFILYINAIIVNFSCGCFISLMMAFAFQQHNQ